MGSRTFIQVSAPIRLLSIMFEISWTLTEAPHEWRTPSIAPISRRDQKDFLETYIIKDGKDLQDHGV